MSKRITYHCPECGSSNIAFDAIAKWCEKTQEFECTNVMDKGHACDDCGATDIDPNEVTID